MSNLNSDKRFNFYKYKNDKNYGYLSSKFDYLKKNYNNWLF